MSKKINITIDKVYTKKGHKGATEIIGEKGVFKSDLRIICYGEVDELNSSIGFCYTLIEECNSLKDMKMLDSIKTIQNDLFNLGTMLAVSKSLDISDFPKVDSENIKFLEDLIDFYNKDLTPLKSFVLPSGTKVGAYLHVCRTICRRVERSCVSLSKKNRLDSNIIAYLNRLSDLLFVWSRWANKKSGKTESLWSV